MGEKECIIKTRTIITGAATLLAGLAWNEVAKSLAELMFAGEGALSKKRKLGVGIAYAVMVTIVIILLVELYNYMSDRFDRSASNPPPPTEGFRDDSLSGKIIGWDLLAK